MTDEGHRSEADYLLRPERIFARGQVLSRPSPVPAVAGVYAWYFDDVPPAVPLYNCHATEGGYLLYVGISPKAPSRDGLRQSSQNLRTRIRYHYRGNAAGSTLRLTLGSLLSEELGIQLRRVGSGHRLTFSDGEPVLSEWMAAHAKVCWIATPSPWLLESRLIEKVTLPLNLDQNKHSGFHQQLSAMRAQQRTRAREAPVVPR